MTKSGITLIYIIKPKENKHPTQRPSQQESSANKSEQTEQIKKRNRTGSTRKQKARYP